MVGVKHADVGILLWMEVSFRLEWRPSMLGNPFNHATFLFVNFNVILLLGSSIHYTMSTIFFISFC